MFFRYQHIEQSAAFSMIVSPRRSRRPRKNPRRHSNFVVNKHLPGQNQSKICHPDLL